MSKDVNKRLDAIEEHLGISKPKTTHIMVIQDRSYSMSSRRKETIDGYNEYLSSLQEDTSDNADLTLIQFDTRSVTVYEAEPVASIKKMTDEDYVLGGGTALLDAVATGLKSLEKRTSDSDRALVVIMTDGEENSSFKHNAATVKRLISRLEEKGNYTFVFLGAGQDAWTGGDLLGLRREQAVYYGEAAYNHGLAYKGLSNTTAALRGGTSMSNTAFGAATTASMAEEGAEVQGVDPVTGQVIPKITINYEGIETGKEDDTPAGSGG